MATPDKTVLQRRATKMVAGRLAEVFRRAEESSFERTTSTTIADQVLQNRSNRELPARRNRGEDPHNSSGKEITKIVGRPPSAEQYRCDQVSGENEEEIDPGPAKRDSFEPQFLS